MGKATRIRQQNAREKIAAQRAAAQQAERRRRLFITGGSILAVVAIVVAFVVVKSLGSSSAPSKPTSATGTALPSSVVNDITNVPASTLQAVGKGSTNPKSIIRLNGTPLTKDGKPEVLYIGAEYCPYCAAERWAMAVALSKFGTFTGLRGIHSSSSDVPPSIPTLTAGVQMAFAGILPAALMVCAPVLLAIVLTDAALGVVSRVVPSLNVFQVGFSAKIAVGLTVLAASLPFVSGWIGDNLQQSVSDALHALKVA